MKIFMKLINWFIAGLKTIWCLIKRFFTSIKGIIALIISFLIFEGWALAFVGIGLIIDDWWLVGVGSAVTAFWATPAPMWALIIALALAIQRYVIFDKKALNIKFIKDEFIKNLNKYKENKNNDKQ